MKNTNSNIPPKPAYRPVIAENIPDELKSYPYWCVWKSEWNGKKWTKPPYSPTGKKLNGKRNDLAQRSGPLLGLG